MKLCKFSDFPLNSGMSEDASLRNCTWDIAIFKVFTSVMDSDSDSDSLASVITAGIVRSPRSSSFIFLSEPLAISDSLPVSNSVFNSSSTNTGVFKIEGITISREYFNLCYLNLFLIYSEIYLFIYLMSTMCNRQVSF